MKKILVNYGNERYAHTQKFNSWTGLHIAKFDQVCSFAPENMEPAFREANSEILSVPRGNGLWLWKPYFILRVMEQAQEGDFIFYCDSGAFFIHRIDEIVQSTVESGGIWVSDNPLLEKNFTKEICFEKMGCQGEMYRETNQVQGTYAGFVNSPASRAFVERWLDLCRQPELMMPKEGGEADLISHREDQSILSLLSKKEGVPAHRDPSHRGRWPQTFYNPDYPYRVPEHNNDRYHSLVFLHKEPKVTLWKCVKVELRCVRSWYRYEIKAKHRRKSA